MGVSLPLKTVFHIKDGPTEMTGGEAVRVIRDFPHEWKATPWDAGKKPAAVTTKDEVTR